MTNIGIISESLKAAGRGIVGTVKWSVQNPKRAVATTVGIGSAVICLKTCDGTSSSQAILSIGGSEVCQAGVPDVTFVDRHGLKSPVDYETDLLYARTCNVTTMFGADGFVILLDRIDPPGDIYPYETSL